MKKEAKEDLTGSFHTKAKLITGINTVADYLNKVGHLRKLLDNRSLRYEVLEKDTNKGSILELSDTYIDLKFFFKNQDAHTYKDKFIVFVSLIGILDGFYEVRLGDLYRYLIEALNQNWQNTIKDQNSIINGLKDRIKSLNESNCLVSYQLIKLSKENVNLLADLSLYKKFCNSAIDMAKEKGPSSHTKDYAPLTTLGIDLELIQKIEYELNNSKG